MKLDNNYPTLILGLLMGLALGIVVGMWSPPATFAIPKECSAQAFWCWLDRWQALVAGAIASGAAYITIWFLRKQLRFQYLTVRRDTVQTLIDRTEHEGEALRRIFDAAKIVEKQLANVLLARDINPGDANHRNITGGNCFLNVLNASELVHQKHRANAYMFKDALTEFSDAWNEDNGGKRINAFNNLKNLAHAQQQYWKESAAWYDERMMTLGREFHGIEIELGYKPDT